MSVPVTECPAICSGRHKTRLLIGEGNFSFASALIHKHDTKACHVPEQSLASSIIATDLNTDVYCYDCNAASPFSNVKISTVASETATDQGLCERCRLTINRIDGLRQKGAIVRLGIDGTKLHEIEEFKGIKRIHWNCPHDGSSYYNQTLPPIIADFFKSCAQIQDSGDRVHVSLAQPLTKMDFYQGYIYDITKAASLAGYVLVKRRKFSEERYPGYEHVMTGSSRPADVTKEGMREFVFTKVTQEAFNEAKTKASESLEDSSRMDLFSDELARELAKGSEKSYSIYTKFFYDKSRSYFFCTTDEDSSDCEE